jgi:uncharacterized membrane protein YphA (DoxX/SURF4 family)
MLVATTTHAPDADPGRSQRRPLCWALTLTRVLSAVVFVSFGLGKFVDHAAETSSFRSYGLPAPAAFTLVIGVLETAGGALLLAGRATRIAGVLLIGDMLGAIVVSGILHGETVSLTLAPALLVAMCLLVALGPGRVPLDSARTD